jgi:N-acetylglucosamine-6-phosphate deacetylase
MDSYIDLQINGCWGVDFNAPHLETDAWLSACQRLAANGTTRFLPTLITDSLDNMTAKLRRLVWLCEQTPPTVAQPIGIHLEGPFLSPESGYIGAHPREHAVPATVAAAGRLLEAGQGWVKMVTLAPEMDPRAEVVHFLSRQGVVVAAGHTDASRAELQRALAAGLACFTHLGNGCPATMARHDNILHRVMSLRGELVVTLIADGFHLPPWLLKMLIDWFGDERTIIVSDAISAAGLPSGYHRLGQQRVWVDRDGVPRSEDKSHFVGSGATLDRMYAMMREEPHWTAAQLQRLFAGNAARLLKTVPPAVRQPSTTAQE